MDLSQLSDGQLQALLAQAQKKAEPSINPMDGIPWYQQFNEGMGKAFVDTGRGLGQIAREGIELVSPPKKGVSDLVTGGRGKSFADKLGLPTREDIDASKKTDAALMDSGWGMTGNIAGNVIPSIFLPGSTIPKALATGAAMGFSQPVGTQDSRMENTAIGAAVNSALPIAGAAYRTGRALVEPVLNPAKTAARVVTQFADDPQALAAAAKDAKEIIAGSRPTLSQAAMQPGISTLERGVMNQPGPMQGSLTQRYAEQNAARLAALGGVAKDDAAMQAAVAAREAASAPGYSAAKAVVVNPDTELAKLLDRPSMKSAWSRAGSLAAENGDDIVANGHMTGSGLHYMKMALDDMIEGGAVQGIGKNERSALIGTKEKLLGWMDKNIPDYAKARATYAEKSQPINEMQFGQALLDKATPALSQAAGTEGNLHAAAYGRALADAGRTAKQAIGKDLPLDTILSPGAKDTVYGVAKDLERAQRAQGLGKAAGSPTAQFLTTQNLMRQVMGPMGLPQGVSDKVASSLMATPVLGSGLQWATKGAESRVQQEVANLILNPTEYSAAMQHLDKLPGPVRKRLLEVAPYLPAATTGGLFGAYGREQ